MTHTGSPDDMPIKVMSAEQADDDPIPAALAAVQTRLGYGRERRLELTQRVDALEAVPEAPNGPAGPAGPTGAAGPAGATGARGLQGVAGPVGAIGAKGDTGDQGPQGLAGAAGTAGAKGDQGTQGIQGAAGAKGDAGAAGPAGAKGDQGIQGAKGDPGKPKRVDLYSAATGLFTFPVPYTAPPVIMPIATWSGLQMVVPGISAVTNVSCVVTVMRSKGTLLLTAGPFEAAAGVNGQFVAIDAV